MFAGAANSSGGGAMFIGERALNEVDKLRRSDMSFAVRPRVRGQIAKSFIHAAPPELTTISGARATNMVLLPELYP